MAFWRSSVMKMSLAIMSTLPVVKAAINAPKSITTNLGFLPIEAAKRLMSSTSAPAS